MVGGAAAADEKEFYLSDDLERSWITKEASSLNSTGWSLGMVAPLNQSQPPS